MQSKYDVVTWNKDNKYWQRSCGSKGEWEEMKIWEQKHQEREGEMDPKVKCGEGVSSSNPLPMETECLGSDG